MRSFVKYCFYHSKMKVISSSHRVIVCLLYNPKQKNVKFHALKQIVKLSRDRSISSLVKIWKYLTVYFSVSHSLLYNKEIYVQ